MQKPYEIITNSKERRVLVMYKLIDVELEEEIRYEDFDAIFLPIVFLSTEELRLALQLISPFKSNKCWIKPRFIRTQVNLHLPGMEYVVDGEGTIPTESHISERIEDILKQIKELKTPRFAVELHSHTLLCLRLCNYCFVRGFLEFSTTMIPGMSMGFSAVFNILFFNVGINKSNALFEFIEKLIDQNCVTFSRYVDRIHLCPQCHSDQLIFIERCPKCQSSNIHQESFIHHFRCANVSPESTYEYDGQLRCPKCKQFVRHIGVDYDRPADIYHCNDCGNDFLQSNMSVYCVDCGKSAKPSDLQPNDIKVFRFTEEGMRKIIDTNAVFTFSKDIWNGYTEYDMYQKQVRWFSQGSGDVDSIVVIRFCLSDSPGLSHQELLAFRQKIHVNFYSYNFTTQGRFFYLSHRCKAEDVAESKEELSRRMSVVQEILSQYKEVSYEDEQFFVLNKGDNSEEFLRRLATTPSRR